MTSEQSMTRIDFHSNVQDKVSHACRLVRKAHLARQRIVLMAEDGDQLRQMNLALWRFSEVDFLPHVLASDVLASRTPIILSDVDCPSWPHFDILLNLSQRTPSGFSRFQRVFEIISQDPQDAAAGRLRYLAYKQQQYPLTHFVAGKS